MSDTNDVMWRPSVLRRLWTLPMALLGRTVAHVSWSYPMRTTEERVVLLRAGGFVEWFLARGNFIAITIGESIFFRAGAENPQPWLLKHELVHVRQARAWGPFFVLAYGAGWLYSLLTTGPKTAYRNNPFEIAARKAENERP